MSQIRRRSYSGSVSVNQEDRRYSIYKHDSEWYLSKMGGSGKVEVFKLKSEAEKRLKELEK